MPGEDPTLNGEYGAAFVAAFQRGLDDDAATARRHTHTHTHTHTRARNNPIAYNLENLRRSRQLLRLFDAAFQPG